MGHLRTDRDRPLDEGFTLIELLVVVIIIGILAAVAIPVFLSQREKARNGAANSDARNLATSMEAYYAEFDEYTDDTASIASQQNGLTEGVEHAVCVYDGDEKYVVAAWHPDGTNLYLFDSARGSLAKLDIAEPRADADVNNAWNTFMLTSVEDAVITDGFCDELDDAVRFV